jgi:hypothetical protein
LVLSSFGKTSGGNTMSATRWNQPVKITTPHSGNQTVHGPFAALIFLLDEWPDMRGPDYVQARSLCRAAIAGRKTPEEAREVFVRAAKEARIIH